MPTVIVYGVPYNIPAPVATELIKLRRQASKNMEFISVFNQLPNTHRTVIVREDDGYKHLGYYIKGHGWFTDYNGRIEGEKITHYADLPEDPEGKNGPLFFMP